MRFASNLARIKPSLAGAPQTAAEASVTNLTHLSTACVWHGNCGKSTTGVSPVATRSLRSSSEMFSVSGGSVI